jgi:hypothetical protein
MSTVTFIITPDSRWPDLKSITLDNSMQVADLIRTLRPQRYQIPNVLREN